MADLLVWLTRGGQSNKIVIVWCAFHIVRKVNRIDIPDGGMTRENAMRMEMGDEEGLQSPTRLQVDEIELERSF